MLCVYIFVYIYIYICIYIYIYTYIYIYIFIYIYIYIYVYLIKKNLQFLAYLYAFQYYFNNLAKIANIINNWFEHNNNVA